jgi:hypothetical protein
MDVMYFIVQNYCDVFYFFSKRFDNFQESSYRLEREEKRENKIGGESQSFPEIRYLCEIKLDPDGYRTRDLAFTQGRSATSNSN